MRFSFSPFAISARRDLTDRRKMPNAFDVIFTSMQTGDNYPY